MARKCGLWWIWEPHNFVVDQVVQSLGLDLKKNDSWVKTVNTEAVLVKGVANTEMKIRLWQKLQYFLGWAVFLLEVVAALPL